MKKIFLCVLLTALVLCGATLGHAASAGVVLTIQPGAWVVRDGKKIELTVKAEVLKGDEIVTDGSGRVQVIFADDTTISLGADTTVAVADFLYDAPGGKASFSADMAKGMARFVTGKVVEQNRSGFSVSTPQATVGIRGTTFAVNVSPKGVTSVIGLDVKGAFPLAVTNKATGNVSEITLSGMAVDAAPGGNTSYQTPPGQFSQSSSSVAGTTVAVATSGTSENSDQGTAQTAAAPSAEVGTAVAAAPVETVSGGTDSVESASLPAPVTVASAAVSAVASTAVASAGSTLYTPEASGDAQSLSNSAGQNADDTLADLGGSGGGMVTPPIVTPPPGPTLTASWSGSIFNGHTNTSGNVGTVSFNTTLFAGAGTITNAQVAVTSGTGSGMVASQTGSSLVIAGIFNANLQVTTGSTDSRFVTGNPGNIAGGISGLGTGSSVSGTWNVDDQWGGPIFSGGPMYFEGTKSP